MRIFFAGATSQFMGSIFAAGGKSFLVSYENPKKCEETATACYGAAPKNAFLLDSGAFSAWNSGRAIDLAEYIAFAKDFIARHKAGIEHIYIVNLDVIPGRRGEVPTTKMVAEAAKEGWANMLEMERAGLTPLHIFHQGEDFSVLDALSKRHRYIGISPSNDASVKDRHAWLQKVYRIIRAGNMTHGFGVTAKRLMRDFPWYSVDSTSWLAPIIYGKTVFTPEFEALGLNSRCKSHTEYVVMEGIRAVLKLEKQISGLWAARGVKWDDDAYDF